jgi:hypothetical protein
VHGSFGDPLTVGIENHDLITVIALVVKHKFVSVMAMCAGCHNFIPQGEFGLKSEAKQCLEGSDLSKPRRKSGLIGTLRRECLDQMLVFGQAHLRRIRITIKRARSWRYRRMLLCIGQVSATESLFIDKQGRPCVGRGCVKYSSRPPGNLEFRRD